MLDIVELWDLGHFPTPHFFLGQKCRTSWDEGLSHHLERSPFSTIQHAVRCGQACLLVALVSSIISPVTFMWGGSWVWRLIFLCPLVRGSGSALSIGSWYTVVVGGIIFRGKYWLYKQIIRYVCKHSQGVNSAETQIFNECDYRGRRRCSYHFVSIHGAELPLLLE